MDLFYEIFGEGKDLNSLQMSSRGVVMFFVAFLLIRIAGRRSFGIKTPIDNIITISLGAVMSRAIVGASPFVPVVICSLVIVVLHRAFAWLAANNRRFGRFVQGEKIILFEQGKFIKSNFDKGLVCEEDIMQGVRKSALTEDLQSVEKVYIERNGEISVIRKGK
ncbi:DUF421 domain-containing protein [Inquilinus sp. KBS0705]|nr:DUF421 domain-containing protein [Inquilinus sp. KBS0705]